MILQFTTDVGSTFQLDRDILTWQRTYNGKVSHGKLYAWPQEVILGKPVHIFNVDPLTRIGKAFLTSKVTNITFIEREQPDVLDKTEGDEPTATAV